MSDPSGTSDKEGQTGTLQVYLYRSRLQSVAPTVIVVPNVPICIARGKPSVWITHLIAGLSTALQTKANVVGSPPTSIKDVEMIYWYIGLKREWIRIDLSKQSCIPVQPLMSGSMLPSPRSVTATTTPRRTVVRPVHELWQVVVCDECPLDCTPITTVGLRKRGRETLASELTTRNTTSVTRDSSSFVSDSNVSKRVRFQPSDVSISPSPERLNRPVFFSVDKQSGRPTSIETTLPLLSSPSSSSRIQTYMSGGLSATAVMPTVSAGGESTTNRQTFAYNGYFRYSPEEKLVEIYAFAEKLNWNVSDQAWAHFAREHHIDPLLLVHYYNRQPGLQRRELQPRSTSMATTRNADNERRYSQHRPDDESVPELEQRDANEEEEMESEEEEEEETGSGSDTDHSQEDHISNWTPSTRPPRHPPSTFAPVKQQTRSTAVPVRNAPVAVPVRNAPVAPPRLIVVPTVAVAHAQPHAQLASFDELRWIHYQALKKRKMGIVSASMTGSLKMATTNSLLRETNASVLNEPAQQKESTVKRPMTTGVGCTRCCRCTKCLGCKPQFQCIVCHGKKWTSAAGRKRHRPVSTAPAVVVTTSIQPLQVKEKVMDSRIKPVASTTTVLFRTMKATPPSAAAATTTNAVVASVLPARLASPVPLNRVTTVPTQSSSTASIATSRPPVHSVRPHATVPISTLITPTSSSSTAHTTKQGTSTAPTLSSLLAHTTKQGTSTAPTLSSATSTTKQGTSSAPTLSSAAHTTKQGTSTALAPSLVRAVKQSTLNASGMVVVRSNHTLFSGNTAAATIASNKGHVSAGGSHHHIVTLTSPTATSVSSPATAVIAAGAPSTAVTAATTDAAALTTTSDPSRCSVVEATRQLLLLHKDDKIDRQRVRDVRRLLDTYFGRIVPSNVWNRSKNALLPFYTHRPTSARGPHTYFKK